MKITLNWLRQYVDFTGSAEELAERLTMLGLEVEGIERSAGEFENIVVGQVITRETHPNADRLSYCRVNDGKGERMIVCGATNFKAGDKIPLALPGAVMPTDPGEPPFIIKVGKIRGCESQGMMCSGKELRLTTDADGLLILPGDACVGQPFAEHLGRATADVILDLEITPNRPDLNSLIGVAREIAAVTGRPLKLPAVSIPAEATASSPKPPVSIQIEDPVLCPRYVGRVLMGVKVGPSPDWLKQSLAKVGIRSINNVVDVTNYVMLETGQPLHAFDLHLLATNPQGLPQIWVRRAREGEEFITLDGLSRKLSAQALLIADPEKAIALAGIMGGQNTEIRPTTTDILIESACFKAESVRATSKALGLKTDASYRFERGADVGICAWANERAAQLILQLGGGKATGENVDAWPSQAPRKSIALRHHRVREILGVDVTAEEQRKFLEGLEIRSTSTTSGETTYEIPSFRVDLKREHDLVEEIGRLYGIDKIPSTPPRGCVGDHAFDAVHDDLAEARTHFTSLGFNEAQGQTLISEAAAALLSPAEQIARLAYPLSSDMNVLRPSLIPGLLDSLKHNLSRQTHDVALFEIGRVFQLQNNQIKEERRCALIMTGARMPRFWKGESRDEKREFVDLKGALEDWFDRMGLRGIQYVARTAPGQAFLEAGDILLGKQTVGQLGQLSPVLARQYDFRDAVLVAELNLDWLLHRRNATRSFKPLPAFPSVRRDIAMLVPESASHEAVLASVRQAKPANLEQVELFDVFRGKHVPEGQKSVAYAFTYRASDRTLTDQEVNAAHEKVVQQLTTSLKASIRS